ncbi:nucleotidyl transferase AbiEii/AbiGii toxin family protein [Nitrosopumilus sp.]|uniref:nucleotidyl transferase AbiEii/AbiGii toxin family protein n=1 Tax=Nitrosopumilus sp. TaxID=2024843 RepID=UPI0034A075E6
MSDFVDRISVDEKIQRKDMIEKDILLHHILLDLSKEKFFAENFLFKGGTCLIKHYLGYVRFSEDIDFTWKNQIRFAGKSGRQIDKEVSEITETTGKILEKISSGRGLDFKWDKGNRDYVELVSRGKICTFKVWYNSDVSKERMYIKIQINFVDNLCLKPIDGNLKSLITGKHDKLGALYEEYAEYASTIPFGVYDVREILSEKIRAILTRKGTKARDFLDVFLISKNLGVETKDVEDCIIKKIGYALEHYERYRDNFEEKKNLLDKGSIFNWGIERGLLITEIDDEELDRFLDDLINYLKELVRKF